MLCHDRDGLPPLSKRESHERQGVLRRPARKCRRTPRQVLTFIGLSARRLYDWLCHRWVTVAISLMDKPRCRHAFDAERPPGFDSNATTSPNRLSRKIQPTSAVRGFTTRDFLRLLAKRLPSERGGQRIDNRNAIALVPSNISQRRRHMEGFSAWLS